MADGPDSTKKTAQAYNDFNSSTPIYDRVRAMAKKVLGMTDDDDEDEKKKKKPPTNVIQALSEPFK